MFKTVEEATSHAARLAERDVMLAAMTSAERQFYFETLNNTPPEDLE